MTYQLKGFPSLRVALAAMVATAGLVAHSAQAQTGPSWPQRFELSDRTPASFGFAVTKAGHIQIDVQAQGAPVVVSVSGPHPMQQPGSGNIQFVYDATDKDVAAGALWGIRIALQDPPKVAGRPLAGGSVTVQAPVADLAALQAQFTAQEPQRKAATARADNQLRAQLGAQLQQSRAQVTKQLDDSRAAAELRARPTLDAMRMRAQVGTRGLAPPPGTRETPATPITEAIPNAERFRRPVSAPPAPPPVITGTNVSQALPRQLVLIQGTGFGTQPGAVLFTVNPGMEQAGAVAAQSWSDTLIGVYVSDFSGIMAFNGSVAVVRAAPDGQRSNAYPFGFAPELEVRQITSTADAFVSPPGVLGQPNDHVFHGWNSFWDMFTGHRGDDMLMPASKLQNGWSVEWSRAYPYFNGGNSSGDAFVSDSRPGTDMAFTRVHWWNDAFTELRYRFAVQIRGPRGVPDGLACTKGAPNPC